MCKEKEIEREIPEEDEKSEKCEKRARDYIEYLEDKLFHPKEVAQCDDIICLKSYKNRECIITDIDEAAAALLDDYISYFNFVDERNNVPVEKRLPIKVYINSGGGSLEEGFHIMSVIQLSKTPVYTICTGYAYSAGFMIFISGHRRFSYPYSSFLFHEGSVSGDVTMDANKFQNYNEFYKVRIQQMRKILLENSHITAEEYQQHSKDDWWFTVEDGVKYGFIDRVLKEFCL